jgi:VanZ family protein
VSNARTLLRPEAPPARVARAWLLVALWTSLVWWLGSESFAAPVTSRYLAPLIEWLWPGGTAAQRFALLMGIRKLAHPAIYAVLAGLAFRAALLSGVSGLARGAAVALALAVSIAGLDELRQSRTQTRTGAAADVALDAAGATVALTALGLLRRRARPSTSDAVVG